MSLPILQPNSIEVPQMRGDVFIDSGVIIASGVILNATPGHKITIHAGVCLGMGTIITAHEGDVEIKSNAILGAGTLILGSCTIGSQASLGTSVTVYHAVIENLAVIPAGAIIGDCSRTLDVVKDEAVVIDKSEEFPTQAISKKEIVEQEEEKETTEIATEQKRNDLYSQNSLIDKINQLNRNNYSKTKTPPSEKETIDNLSSEYNNNFPNTVNNSESQKEYDQKDISQQSIATEKDKENNNNLESATQQVNSQAPSTIDPQESSESDNIEKSNLSSQSIIEKKEVVGKVYISRLLYTLFPERNSNNN